MDKCGIFNLFDTLGHEMITERASIQLFNLDCMEAMKEMPDKAFDLAIVDPPYGILQIAHRTIGATNLAKTKEYNMAWDKDPVSKECLDQLRRVSKNQIVFGANHFISRIPFDSSCWVVWDKDNTGNFADCELAWTSFKTSVRIFKYRWNGMLQQNMKEKEHRIHPTQKPVALYKWILKNYANPGDKILDTHLGSGSIAIACWDMGFDLTGYEIDKDYFEAAKARLERHKAQGQLF